MKRMKQVLVLLFLSAVVSLFVSCKGNTTVQITLMDDDTVIETLTVPKGETLKASNPTKPGYAFQKWYKDATLDTEFDRASTLETDMTLYAHFTPNQYRIVVDGDEYLDVTFGAAYSLEDMEIPARTGQNFAGFLYNGLPFPATGVYNYPNNIGVFTKWEPKTYITVMDYQNHQTKYEVVDGTYNLPAPAAREGYNFGGYLLDNESFAASGSYTGGSITVYENWIAKIYISVYNGATLYQKVEVVDGVYTPWQDPDDTIEHAFEGYTSGGAPFLNNGIYTGGESTTVFIQWSGIVYIYFDSRGGEGAIPSVRVEDGEYSTEGIAEPTKDGYYFKGWFTAVTGGTAVTLDGTYTGAGSVTYYAQWTPKVFIYIYDGDLLDRTVEVFEGEAYDLGIPEKTGSLFVHYQRITNNAVFAGSGTYEGTASVSVKIVWDTLGEAFNNDGTQSLKYFKEYNPQTERINYVFLTGQTYAFSAPITVSGNDGNVTVAADRLSFTAVKAGAFTLTTATRTIDARVVNHITGIGPGSDYVNSWVNPNAATFDHTSAGDTMQVGVSRYIPDLYTLSGAVNADYLTAFANGSLQVSVTDAAGNAIDAYTVRADGSLDFNLSLIGQTVRVTLTPTYVVTGSGINPSYTFEMKLNGGVNIYTNDEMHTMYADLSVREINILRNIKVVLHPEQYYPDSSVPRNDWEYSAYMRMTRTEPDAVADSITINGNYFQLNGAELPLVDNRHPEDPFTGTEEGGYSIGNVQVGVLAYYTLTFADGVTQDQGNAVDTIVIRNLFVTGNKTRDNSTTESEVGSSVQRLVMGSAYNGVVVRGGTATLDNVSIRQACQGLFLVGGYDNNDSTTEVESCQVTLQDVKIDNCFSGSVYAWRQASVTIRSSYFGQSSGAAIHFDDIPSVSPTAHTLSLDADTVVENWVSGAEAWFVAYGKADLAMMVKAQIENLVTAVNYAATDPDLKAALQLYYGVSYELIPGSVIKDVGGTTFFNFVMLTRSPGYDNSEWIDEGADYHDEPYVHLLADSTVVSTASLATLSQFLVSLGQSDAAALAPFSYAVFHNYMILKMGSASPDGVMYLTTRLIQP